MHQKIKENPKTAITLVASIITALAGVAYTTLDKGATFLDNVATKKYVNIRFTEVSLDVIDAQIRLEEGREMRVNFLIETGKDQPVDRLLLKRTQIELINLREKRKDMIKEHRQNK